MWDQTESLCLKNWPTLFRSTKTQHTWGAPLFHVEPTYYQLSFFFHLFSGWCVLHSTVLVPCDFTVQLPAPVPLQLQFLQPLFHLAPVKCRCDTERAAFVGQCARSPFWFPSKCQVVEMQHLDALDSIFTLVTLSFDIFSLQNHEHFPTGSSACYF